MSVLKVAFSNAVKWFELKLLLYRYIIILIASNSTLRLNLLSVESIPHSLDSLIPLQSHESMVPPSQQSRVPWSVYVFWGPAPLCRRVTPLVGTLALSRQSRAPTIIPAISFLRPDIESYPFTIFRRIIL